MHMRIEPAQRISQPASQRLRIPRGNNIPIIARLPQQNIAQRPPDQKGLLPLVPKKLSCQL